MSLLETFGPWNIGTVSGTSKLTWIGASLDFEEFIKLSKPRQFKPINKYPSIKLDTSILIREDIPWMDVKKVILDANQKLIFETFPNEKSKIKWRKFCK